MRTFVQCGNPREWAAPPDPVLSRHIRPVLHRPVVGGKRIEEKIVAEDLETEDGTAEKGVLADEIEVVPDQAAIQRRRIGEESRQQGMQSSSATHGRTSRSAIISATGDAERRQPWVMDRHGCERQREHGVHEGRKARDFPSDLSCPIPRDLRILSTKHPPKKIQPPDLRRSGRLKSDF